MCIYYIKKIKPPKCYCGDKLKFISLTQGYDNYCCSDCRQKKEKYNMENILKIILNDGLNFSSYEYRQIKKHLNMSSEDVYLIKYPNSNICCVCGKNTRYKNSQVGFSKTCSYECGNSLPRRKLNNSEKENASIKRKQTNMEKYGVEYNLQLLDHTGEKIQ